MTEKQEIVRANLIEVARRRGTITYSEAARWIGITAIGIGPNVLDPINEYEHARGRPLLSAVVVGKSSGSPGVASTLWQLGWASTQEATKEGYWRQEVQAVYNTWAE